MGLLSFSNHKFYFRALTRSERRLARETGFKLEADTLRWVSRSYEKACVLRRYADSSAERKLKNYFITDLTPPEYIVYPDHLSPRLSQIESCWHMLTRTPCYDADEAGLGKTATAIMAINSSPGTASLIICPPYLKYNWMDELNTWRVLASIPTISMIENEESNFNANAVVLPDSLLSHPRIQQRLVKSSFKWIVVDEAHRFKTADSQRGISLLGDGKDGSFSIESLGERFVALSGTPFPNGKPIELYPVVSKLAPEAIGYRTLEEYGKTFCAGKLVTRFEGKKPIQTWDFSGASHLGTLKKELRSKFMIRHLKRDCLKELGPKTRQLIFLDTPKSIHKFESSLLKARSLEELMGEDFTLGEVARYRKEVGLCKIKGAVEYITDLLESSDEKLVVSAYHIEVVESLHKALDVYGSLKIRGGMSAQDKNEAVKSFQTKAHCRVMVGNTLAMGLGNTLTRSSTLVVVEPEWSPGINEQMEDRIHRISQDKHVLCKYLVLRNSLDERMLRRALNKEDNIQALMN